MAFISLSGGTPGAALLTANDGALPMIRSERSTVQALVEDAPDLLAQATDLLAQFQGLTSPENQALVTGILRNLETSSGRLDQALNDFSEISGTVSEATAQISIFTGKLDSISSSVQTTLDRADAALISAQTAFDFRRYGACGLWQRNPERRRHVRCRADPAARYDPAHFGEAVGVCRGPQTSPSQICNSVAQQPSKGSAKQRIC